MALVGGGAAQNAKKHVIGSLLTTVTPPNSRRGWRQSWQSTPEAMPAEGKSAHFSVHVVALGTMPTAAGRLYAHAGMI